MSLAQQINVIVEQLPEQEQALVLELARRIALADDVLTDENMADIEQARAEYARDATVSMDDIALPYTHPLALALPVGYNVYHTDTGG